MPLLLKELEVRTADIIRRKRVHTREILPKVPVCCFRKPMRTILAIFTALTLISAHSLLRVAAQDAPPDQTQILFIENIAAPAMKTIIRSLESQGAPVPVELTDLLALQGKPDEFYAHAASYFGLGWQERLTRDASSVRTPEDALMVRTRIYLTSLAANADRIARTSPVKAEEIRGIVQNLLRQSQAAETEEERKNFFRALKEAEERIFPVEGGLTIEGNLWSAQKFLEELKDAIDILVDGFSANSLRKELTDLELRARSISGNQELTAWFATFDAFAEKLLSHAKPVDHEVILVNAKELLRKLHAYLQDLEQNGIETHGFTEESAALLTKRSEPMNAEEFEVFIASLEDLLMRISESFPTS